MHEVTADRAHREHLRKFGQVEQPVRVPRRPIVIGTLGDAIHMVMSLGRFL